MYNTFYLMREGKFEIVGFGGKWRRAPWCGNEDLIRIEIGSFLLVSENLGFLLMMDYFMVSYRRVSLALDTF